MLQAPEDLSITAFLRSWCISFDLIFFVCTRTSCRRRLKMYVILLSIFFANSARALILPENVLVDESFDDSKLISVWAPNAYEWFMNVNCTEQSNLLEETCLLMKLTPKHHFRIYGVESQANRKFAAVFPDGENTKHKIFHDGVLVLDAFPSARFGHPILFFYVDLKSKKAECEAVKGFLVGKCGEFLFAT